VSLTHSVNLVTEWSTEVFPERNVLQGRFGQSSNSRDPLSARFASVLFVKIPVGDVVSEVYDDDAS